jgi:S-methylmethionine-dependent homocysteine/selenocysteine methylase
MAVLILDGAMGTELIARGLTLEGSDWSARAIFEAPNLIAEVHADYARAGASLHTANTFRTQPSAFGENWAEAARTAIGIAQRSVPQCHLVLGSMAPVEDCYRPDLSPGERSREDHRAIAEVLADAGCDVLLCETFAHDVEARVATEEAIRTGLPVWLSLTAGPFGELMSPAELATIAMDVASIGVERILVNCIAATQMQEYVEAVAALGLPFGAYANAGAKEERLGWGATDARAAESYAELAQGWVDAGATVIGGCCGTGPPHIEALAQRFG